MRLLMISESDKSLSLWERVAAQPSGEGGLQYKAGAISTRPHPPLRGTFSRREKDLNHNKLRGSIHGKVR
jgi:hypothetical protein